MNTADLFGSMLCPERRNEPLCMGAVVLRSFALTEETLLLQAIDAVVAKAPFRHLVTPAHWAGSAIVVVIAMTRLTRIAASIGHRCRIFS